MKTAQIFSFRGLSVALGLAFSFSLVGSAHAGPGPQYWRNAGKPEQSQPTGRSGEPCGIACTDSKTIPLTEHRNEWSNGRGPSREVVVGAEQVCTSCATTTVMKPSWSNGRGPMQAVTVPAMHVCRISSAPRRG